MSYQSASPAAAERRLGPGIDIRPVAHILGYLLLALGLAMLAPALLDLSNGDPNWTAFLKAGVATALTGGLTALACHNVEVHALTVRQAFLLTTSTWTLLPLFGALPFIIGAPGAGFTDAYFEAVSGITTTGSSVFTGLDHLPSGVLLWRGTLNWLGGLGISFVAMIFLPMMRVGGMQFFMTEGFDTMGKILPRARDIARALLVFYCLLTAACITTYMIFGMTLLDAVVNSFATVATGGFSTSDLSFGKYAGPAEYAGAVFMILSSLPYIRFVQMIRGQARPMLRDPQARAFLRWITISVGIVVVYRLATSADHFEPVLRTTLFNLVSIFTGTGFGSANVANWGDFAVVVAFAVGLVGGCSSSSSGAFTVFRTLILGQAIKAQIQKVHSPNRLAPIRYDGVVVAEDVVNQVVMYITGYIVTIMVCAILITLTGADIESSLLAVWTSIGNIGYVFGTMTEPTGTMVAFAPFAKWVMIAAMLLGRLGMLAVFVVLMPRFWRV